MHVYITTTISSQNPSFAPTFIKIGLNRTPYVHIIILKIGLFIWLEYFI